VMRKTYWALGSHQDVTASNRCPVRGPVEAPELTWSCPLADAWRDLPAYHRVRTIEHPSTWLLEHYT
jgi:hypothetical protein